MDFDYSAHSLYGSHVTSFSEGAGRNKRNRSEADRGLLAPEEQQYGGNHQGLDLLLHGSESDGNHKHGESPTWQQVIYAVNECLLTRISPQIGVKAFNFIIALLWMHDDF